MSCAKTVEPIEMAWMPFAVWTPVGPRNRVLGGGHTQGRAIPARVIQSYSVGGSSDAAIRCCYCGNFLVRLQVQLNSSTFSFT